MRTTTIIGDDSPSPLWRHGEVTTITEVGRFEHRPAFVTIKPNETPSAVAKKLAAEGKCGIEIAIVDM